MATLLDQLRKTNKATLKRGSGPLQETSQEELQNLASQAGMPSTPSSPMGAEGIGATADQAKMLGTPAQLQGATRMQLREQDQLSTQQRQQQARKASTAEEQAAQARAMQFEGLGSLGKRVQQIATGMLNQAGTGQNVIQKVRLADADQINKYKKPEADAQETTDLLNKLGANNITDQEVLQLAGNLGFTEVADLPALKNSIASTFLKEEEQVGQFTAGRIDDTVKFSQFTPEQVQSLGFQNLDELATALQVDPAELSGMTLGEFQNTFGKETLEDFARVNEAQRILGDPSASRAEKENALFILRELGGTGIRAAEDDVKRVETQIQNADQVKFGGESYTVEQLLSDDSIKGLVSKFFTDAEFAKTMKEKEPDFAKWIEDNKKILTVASADVDARQKSFADLQAENMKIGTTDAGSLTETALKSFIPDYGKLKAERYNTPAFIGIIKNKEVPADTAANMINTMNDLATVDPEYVQSMAGLSVNEINALGLNTSDGITKYRQYVHRTEGVIKAPEEEILARVTDGAFDDSSIEEIAQSNDALAAFGLGGVNDAGMQLISAYRSGGPEALRQEYIKQTGGIATDGEPLTVREMLEKGIKATSITGGRETIAAANASIVAKANSNDLFRKYGKYWKGDNAFTPGEAAGIGNGMLQNQDINQYYDLERLRDSANMSPASRQELNYYLDKTGESVSQRLLDEKGYGSRGNWEADIKRAAEGNLDGGGLQKMEDAMRMLQSDMTKGEYKGTAFQKHIDWRIQEMGKAVSNQRAINIRRAMDEANAEALRREMQQVKNFGKLVKYGVGGANALAFDAYRELDAVMQDKLGFGLPFAGGVEAVNKKIDQVSEGIAKFGRDMFKDPRRLGRALATGGLSEGAKEIQKIGGDLSDGTKRAIDEGKKQAEKAGGAVAQAWSAVSSPLGGGGGGGDTVLCTALYSQGKMSKEDWVSVDRAASNFTRRQLKLYRNWGKHLAALMLKSPKLTALLRPWILSWSQHISGKKSFMSYISYGMLWLLSHSLGRILK
jgi:hypothetical protein